MNERDKCRAGAKQHIHEGSFDYTLPRPPALGEERAYTASERGAQPHHHPDRQRHQKSSSPVPKSCYEYEEVRPVSRPSSRHDRVQMSPQTPACLTWAQSLHNLLQDPDGVKLFLRYLESEGSHHADTLHFWFACEGLKNHSQTEKIHKLVKLIYKTYFMKPAFPINDDLKKQIMKNMKSPQCLDPPITLFDEAQAQIEYLINKTTYPNFLKSDMYLQYLQSVESPSSCSDEFISESSSSSSSVSNKDLGNLASGIGPLPTLHEGMEFNVNPQQPLLLTPGTASVSTGYHTPTVRLTKDMLLRSQKHRALDIRPKSETYAGLIYRSNGAHAAYNSYNPVSRQDSEMQSLSSHSDARTESDNMSLNESKIGDGKASGRRHKSLEEKQVRQFTARNKETNMNQTLIPRTQRMDVVNQLLPMEEHAALLMQKLENLKRQQESQELFHRRLKESDSLCSPLDPVARDKLQFQDDSDQHILDEHVSRVFSDHSPSVSPGGGATPDGRPRAPPSTHSADSGNVRDAPPPPVRRPRPAAAADPLTDSGVSVVSDAASAGAAPRDGRVVAWLVEAARGGRAGGRRRAAGAPGAAPAQPFIADPSMPPLPLPDTDIQLEEIRRRLTEDNGRSRSKQRSSNKYYPEITQSSQSTLRKSTRGQRPILPSTEDVTTVVFSFCDEQFPYRTKMPGSQITLKDFKEYLPKKGNYRFFFKTVCDDEVTHEEVSNDNEVLPLWEGKIMAQVKQTD